MSTKTDLLINALILQRKYRVSIILSNGVPFISAACTISKKPATPRQYRTSLVISSSSISTTFLTSSSRELWKQTRQFRVFLRYEWPPNLLKTPLIIYIDLWRSDRNTHSLVSTTLESACSYFFLNAKPYENIKILFF